MSRTTQFIGLTNDASKYVSELKQLNSDTYTTGMFGEKISLGKWCAPKKLQQLYHNICIREIVQAEPWSSGPMIFTCLELDFDDGVKNQFLQWIKDPQVSNEIDLKEGRFWV